MYVFFHSGVPKPPKESPTSKEEDDEEEPERLTCPITRGLFKDPVFVPESGNTYEARALNQANTHEIKFPFFLVCTARG